MTGITFQQMTSLVLSEAHRIEIGQQHLIDTGIRTFADPGMLERKATFEAIARLIGVIVADGVIVERLHKAKIAKLKQQQQVKQKQITTNRGLGSDSAGVPDDSG